MRFRFCGDLDCPDWVLTEMNILSKITSVRMKLLCGQVINELLGGQIDYVKVNKLVSVAKFDLSDVKASIAAIAFIITNAVKFNVDTDTLSNELQQLGLPKEHTRAISKTYGTKSDKLQVAIKNSSLRGPVLKSLDWRVDYVISSSALKDANAPSIQLRLNLTSPEGPQVASFDVSDDTFGVLLNDLKQAKAIMDGIV